MRLRISGERRAQASPAGAPLRAGLFLIALMGVATPAAAQDVAPVVSPDRIEDAPSIKPDPYPDFDNFAWRAFIALNWP